MMRYFENYLRQEYRIVDYGVSINFVKTEPICLLFLVIDMHYTFIKEVTQMNF